MDKNHNYIFTKEVESDLFEIVDMISYAIELSAIGVSRHGKRVAYISKQIYENLYNEEVPQELIIAAVLHDIGTQNFLIRHDLGNLFPQEHNLKKHSIDGERLLKAVSLFEEIALIVRHHHSSFGDIKNIISSKDAIYSNIINLADRIDVSINNNENILSQAMDISDKIRSFPEGFFESGHITAFNSIALKKSFWLDIGNSEFVDSEIKRIISKKACLSYAQISQVADLCAKIIDRKSHYTAMHSINVAEAAWTISRLLGLDEEKCFLIKIAGKLHDLGKLGVPEEVLHKPAELDKKELGLIHQHTYYTFHVMNKVDIFNDIKKWAAYHHENLDGSGYPFRVRDEEISMETRIVSVADKLVALTEDRPYRPKKKKDEVINILRNMEINNKIDKRVLDIVIHNYDFILSNFRVCDKEEDAKEMKTAT